MHFFDHICFPTTGRNAWFQFKQQFNVSTTYPIQFTFSRVDLQVNELYKTIQFKCLSLNRASHMGQGHWPTGLLGITWHTFNMIVMGIMTDGWVSHYV
jgi:hypothetical protein